MPDQTILVTLPPEQLKQLLADAATQAIEKYREATKEQPVPKQKIKEAFGIKSDEAFYALRKRTGAEAVETYGNVPFYFLSDFLKH